MSNANITQSYFIDSRNNARAYEGVSSEDQVVYDTTTHVIASKLDPDRVLAKFRSLPSGSYFVMDLINDSGTLMQKIGKSKAACFEEDEESGEPEFTIYSSIDKNLLVTPVSVKVETLPASVGLLRLVSKPKQISIQAEAKACMEELLKVEAAPSAKTSRKFLMKSLSISKKRADYLLAELGDYAPKESSTE